MAELVEVRHDDNVVIATLSGDIDIGNAAVISTGIVESVPNDATGLVIDLANVRYIDSAGIRMFFDIARQLERCRQHMGIALEDDSPVRRLLKITNIQEVVTLCSSVDECAEAVRVA